MKFLLILQAHLASSVYQHGYLLPGRRIRENVSYRDSSAIRETFLTNFCTNLIDCFDMFLLHSEFRSTNKYFQWTTDNDVIMCREVLVSEPYKFKLRTPERGQAWESVAQQLNSIHQPIFRVTTRSVRDRFSLLSTKYAHKLRMEEKASGIEVEQSELEKLIEEILEREKNAKNELESKEREKKSKAEKEKASAEEVRKQAMERMAKRKGDDEENREKKPKIRRSTADAIDYLREKSSNEKEYRKEELEIRKREIQLQAEKQDQTQRQQQAMFSAMMAQIQQQQQQQQNMMSLMKTLMENYKKA